MEGQGALTDAELDDLKTLIAKNADDGGDAIFQNQVQLALDAKEKGKFEQVSYDKTTGNYNQFWMAGRDWDIRTSLIIDPPNGQFPPLDAARRRAAARGRRGTGVGGAEGSKPDRAAAPMDRKICRSASAASRSVRRGPAPATTATCRSFSRRQPSSFSRRWPTTRASSRSTEAASPVDRAAVARRSTRTLGRRHAGRRDDELS